MSAPPVPNKPIPEVTATNAPYFEGCAQGELRLQSCTRCDRLFRFNHQWCPYCWSLDLSVVRASGHGTISHFSVVSVAPYAAFEADVPYVLALIDLEEGVRMMSNIVDCPPEDVHIGMPVAVRFEQRGEVWIPVFAPA